MTGILAYHDLDERIKAGVTNVAPRAFCRQLDYLREQGHSFCSLPHLLEHTSERTGLCVTFDDAMESQLTVALPELLARGIHATVFVVTAFVGRRALWDYSAGKRRHADWSQLREWAGAGLHVGSHSCTHRDLRKLTTSELQTELSDSKNILEDELQQPVVSISYPFGRYDPRVIEAVGSAKYKLAVTTRPGLMLNRPLALPRVVASRLDTPLALEHRLSASAWGRLERTKQRVVSTWAGGTIRFQQIRGDYRARDRRWNTRPNQSSQRF